MQAPAFTEITLDQLAGKLSSYKEDGWRFANLCGTTAGNMVEILISFTLDEKIDNLLLFVEKGVKVPAVSKIFPSAFLYENETFDLYGVKFDGTILDFDGRFYITSVPTPMNPHSLAAEEYLASSSDEEANNG
ncbi:MAG: NADH-quinone oxidoreductase subunit C [Coriobacteriia bacterium]|nr:NADH-quinone oxidoreductase subunit C [Coriobacteriia bacterium]MCL2750544.1 NADH-quinone oxidoreductase subunit C [Coriobacteriia bacterium]